MDVAHQQQFDEMLNTHKAQLEQEKLSLRVGSISYLFRCLNSIQVWLSIHQLVTGKISYQTYLFMTGCV